MTDYAKHIEGTCPSCKKNATFDFIGEQQWTHKAPDALYVCRACESSHTEATINAATVESLCASFDHAKPAMPRVPAPDVDIQTLYDYFDKFPLHRKDR